MPNQTSAEHNEINEQLLERFKQLPQVVQNAITSADVQQRLRTLSNKNHLHLDQWGALENEVMLTLLGIQSAENLSLNIQKHVGLPPEIATPLTEEVMKIVFEPIRLEMERELQHPEAQAVVKTAIDSVRTEALKQETAQDKTQDTAAPLPTTTPIIPPQPLAPLPTPPETKATRGIITPSYASAPSHERKTIEGDPYREQIT